MKTIKLKVYKEEIGGRPTFLTTYDLLKTAVNNPPQGGFSVEDMKNRLRLLNVLDKHKSEFDIKDGQFKDEMLNIEADMDIEDADFTKLKSLFDEMKWGAVSTAILEISDNLAEIAKSSK